ncbi:MAG: hypothetical protein K0S22_1978 [Oscillospiraceae bacterium]|nr:hypothetical protein [Oscillospiraceae bacterium]
MKKLYKIIFSVFTIFLCLLSSALLTKLIVTIPIFAILIYFLSESIFEHAKSALNNDTYEKIYALHDEIQMILALGLGYLAALIWFFMTV